MQRAKSAKNRKTPGLTVAELAKHASTRLKNNKPSRKSAQPSKGVKESLALLTFRDRTTLDDAYIVQLTEEQLGKVHQSTFGESFPREQFYQYIQSGAPTVVVENNGKRMGYYSYLIGPDAKMHISAMVLEPHYQSQGLGTEVMKRLEADAIAKGVNTLEVFVQANNEKSLAFTRKLGFMEAFRLEPNTICFRKRVNFPDVP